MNKDFLLSIGRFLVKYKQVGGVISFLLAMMYYCFYIEWGQAIPPNRLESFVFLTSTAGFLLLDSIRLMVGKNVSFEKEDTYSPK